MPKFMTYQRPMPVNKSGGAGKPGAPLGKPGKQAPKPAPELRQPQLELELKLPGLPKSR